MKNKELQVVYKNTKELIPYVNNSRTHSDKQVQQIASSIKEWGFTNPILIDENNGIIAGHGRLMAAEKLKLDTVPTIKLVGLTELQKKAYIIADNKLALNSGWDEELLKIELSELKDNNFDMQLLGFDDIELLENEPDFIPQSDENSVPEVKKEAKSKLGDIFILGNHRLMCGDSTVLSDVEKLMNDNKADLWITDPPYNVSYTGKTKDSLSIKNDSMEDENFKQFLIDSYSNADSVMKEGAVFYIWHADSEGYNFRSAAKDVGWKVRECLIWNKSQFVIGRQDYHWKHEPCLYGWKDGASHNWYSDRKQTTVLEFKKPTRNGEHPTMKPVELFEYQILNSSKKGDIVLDSFLGSGTTIIACEKNNRKCYGLEFDPIYVDVIIRRWQEFTDKKAILESTGQEFDSL
ncbi:MAG: hypothetical protein QG564_1821 [Campylobacterota bacterium]|nr:hypothetical protein [Campylobacterota bacterium]